MTHDHDQGLARDLRLLERTTVGRRRVLRWAAGVGVGITVLPVFGCGSGGRSASDGSSDQNSDGDGAASCTSIPEETAGPYPGDGSNGPNVLTESGIVRSDIRSSIGNAQGTAQGVDLSVTLTLVDTAIGCAPLVGYAVYLWHCDRDGNYSLYSNGVTDQNYLRGVQESDESGQVTFQTIFPACYDGRWPHIHFEVYPTLAAATEAGNKVATSQLALPEDVCSEVYVEAGYEQSVVNLQRVSLATDNVFSDGSTEQLATISGGAAEGYAATLTVGVTS